MSALRFYLASASPRRLELLRQIGIDPIVAPANVDERVRAGEAPEHFVRRLAERKARAAAERLADATDGLLLAADTAVVIDGESLGKPTDPAESAAMLRRLRGRTHEVLTAVFLLRTDDGRSVGEVDSTRVHFRPFDDATVAVYVRSGEGVDKAGAYAIQGRGVLLVERIEGSWSNVVGLPLERLPDWVSRLGIDLGGWTDAQPPTSSR